MTCSRRGGCGRRATAASTRRGAAPCVAAAVVVVGGGGGGGGGVADDDNDDDDGAVGGADYGSGVVAAPSAHAQKAAMLRVSGLWLWRDVYVECLPVGAQETTTVVRALHTHENGSSSRDISLFESPPLLQMILHKLRNGDALDYKPAATNVKETKGAAPTTQPLSIVSLELFP